MLNSRNPELVFLSESQVYQSEVDSLLKYIKGNYFFSLNSDDKYDPTLPLEKNYSRGGTLVLWRHDLDPYVKIHPVTTPAFTPLILSLPNTVLTIHIVIYLPTSGRDSEFISEMASLRACMEELRDVYPNALFFVRGDSNVNIKNKSRVHIFNAFLNDFRLTRVNISHNTYHHFIGQGKYDSNIDVILNPVSINYMEEVKEIICRNRSANHPSHHDAIISTIYLFPTKSKNIEPEPTLSPSFAPRLPNERIKIKWTAEGVPLYKSIIGDLLHQLRDLFLINESESCFSLLIDCTNYLLNTCASKTNHVIKATGVPKSL